MTLRVEVLLPIEPNVSLRVDCLVIMSGPKRRQEITGLSRFAPICYPEHTVDVRRLLQRVFWASVDGSPNVLVQRELLLCAQ